VAQILGDGTRKRSRMFEALQSHYLFDDRFGRPARGNDKGKVEGMVGFARRTFMVPVPTAPDIEALNAMLLEHCRERLAAVLRGSEGANIGARLETDRAAFMDLPATPLDACHKRPGRVSSLSLVRYRNTDYSVPVAYAHRDVMVKAYVDEVVIEAGAEEIARHRRSYAAEDFVFDPLHYLDLLERKVNALDQAAPLQGWELGEEFDRFRRLMEPLAGIDDTEVPFSLPLGWAWVRLGALIDLISGQHLQPPEYTEDPGGGLPYITGPSDFGPEGLIIRRYAFARKAVARRGQLLLTVKGSGVGKATNCDVDEVAISRQLMALTTISWSPDFLKLVADRLSTKLQGEARSLIPCISQEDVTGFVVALPPLAEQHRIVAKVEALMALCDRLEAALAAADTTRARLFEALLHEALMPAAAKLEAAE